MSEVAGRMESGEPLETLGMAQAEMEAYLEELLREHAEEVAAENGTTPAEELASPGFAAVRATSSYMVRLVAANNAFLTRRLLDMGVLDLGRLDEARAEEAGRPAGG